MKKFALFSTLFALILSALFVVNASIASNAQDSLKDDEAKLRHLKKVLWKRAYREQDTKLLDRILADEFQAIFDDGSWSTKSQEMKYIEKNRPDYDSFEYTIKRLDIFENGTAIVAGEGHVQGKNDDGPYEYRYQSSNVLIKREGVWKAISSHVSGVKRSKPGE